MKTLTTSIYALYREYKLFYYVPPLFVFSTSLSLFFPVSFLYPIPIPVFVYPLCFQFPCIVAPVFVFWYSSVLILHLCIALLIPFVFIDVSTTPSALPCHCLDILISPYV